MTGAARAVLRAASRRVVMAVAMSRQVLREDGTVTPIVDSVGALSQPAWDVEMMAIYHRAKVARMNRESEKAAKG